MSNDVKIWIKRTVIDFYAEIHSSLESIIWYTTARNRPLGYWIPNNSVGFRTFTQVIAINSI